jgi:hypothetical protein
MKQVFSSSYSRFPISLNAKGACGVMIVSHAFGTLTLRISLRFTFLSELLEPRVATSLFQITKVSTERSGSVYMELMGWKVGNHTR